MYAVLFNNYKRPETLMRRRSIHYTNAGKISGPLCVCARGTFRFCLFCGEGEMKLVCVFFLFTSCSTARRGKLWQGNERRYPNWLRFRRPFFRKCFTAPNERARALEFLIITVAKVFAFSLDFD
jgi:hypothetical protein